MSNIGESNISNYIVGEDTSIYEVMAIIDRNHKKIAFVCENLKLLATITDGDIRRFILSNGDVSLPVKLAAKYNPISLKVNSTEDPYNYMRNHSVVAMPIVDAKGVLVSIVFGNNEKISASGRISVPVVVMAGGVGSRLRPYTHVLPKPLIPIGDKTIIEHIFDHFHKYGCSDFRIIVNHKRGLIKAYFSEDNNRPYTISFFDEENFLGTGGGLSLLAGHLNTTFFLTNCDILVKADFSDVYNQHIKNSNFLTMVCAVKKMTIPYGIVEVTSSGTVSKLQEKPSFEFNANTGVYVLQPEFLSIIPQNTEVHITDLIQTCINSGKKIGVYPVYENAWMDMGQMDMLDAMRNKFETPLR